jgi:hypothetical protein
MSFVGGPGSRKPVTKYFSPASRPASNTLAVRLTIRLERSEAIEQLELSVAVEPFGKTQGKLMERAVSGGCRKAPRLIPCTNP